MNRLLGRCLRRWPKPVNNRTECSHLQYFAMCAWSRESLKTEACSIDVLAFVFAFHRSRPFHMAIRASESIFGQGSSKFSGSFANFYYCAIGSFILSRKVWMYEECSLWLRSNALQGFLIMVLIKYLPWSLDTKFKMPQVANTKLSCFSVALRIVHF